jgi:hypothetical protein
MRVHLQEEANESCRAGTVNNWLGTIMKTHHLFSYVDLLLDLIKDAVEDDAKRLLGRVSREYVRNCQIGDSVFWNAYRLPQAKVEFILSFFDDEELRKHYLDREVINARVCPSREEISFIRQVIQRVRTPDFLRKLKAAVREGSDLMASIDERLAALAQSLSDGQPSSEVAAGVAN